MKPILLNHPTPQQRIAIEVLVPIGLYCNRAIQDAKIGEVVIFEDDWRRREYSIAHKRKVKINSVEFTRYARLLYSPYATANDVIEQWKTECLINGLGRHAFDENECLYVEFDKVENEVGIAVSRLEE